MGEPKKALEPLSKAADLDPTEVVILKHLGRAQEAAGDAYRAANILDLPAGRYTVLMPWIQDDWRISSTLTLNLGLRWEWNGRPQSEDNSISTVVKLIFFFGANAVTTGLIANLHRARADLATTEQLHRSFDCHAVLHLLECAHRLRNSIIGVGHQAGTAGMALRGGQVMA